MTVGMMCRRSPYCIDMDRASLFLRCGRVLQEWRWKNDGENHTRPCREDCVGWKLYAQPETRPACFAVLIQSETLKFGCPWRSLQERKAQPALAHRCRPRPRACLTCNNFFLAVDLPF